MPRALYKIFDFLVGFLSFLFWVLMLFGFNTPFVAILTVISALIHEGGHILALIMTGRYAGLPRFVLSGFRISGHRTSSYREELFVLAAGPGANILAALFLLLLSNFLGRYFKIFAAINLLTAASNLIPVRSYDGYKIIKILLSLKSPVPRGEKIMEIISFTLVVIMTFLSLYFIMTVGEGYWIFAIFFISMLFSIFRGKNVKKRGFKSFRENRRDF